MLKAEVSPRCEDYGMLYSILAGIPVRVELDFDVATTTTLAICVFEI